MKLLQVQQRIGYCPQFDALLERMTGRELLTMFARLRGIPEALIKDAVEAEISRLDLSKHASKQCGKYRYGTRDRPNDLRSLTLFMISIITLSQSLLFSI